MVEWLNHNQGAVMAVLTLVYVLTTITLALFTYKSLTVAQNVGRESVRPYLVFDIQVRDLSVYAILKNLGRTPARNVRIRIKPLLEVASGQKKTECHLTSVTIPLMAPGREIVDLVDGGPRFHELYPDTIFHGTIVYSDTRENTYSEEFEVSPVFEFDIARVGAIHPLDELPRIRMALENIERKLPNA